jgi:hypothetical protein
MKYLSMFFIGSNIHSKRSFEYPWLSIYIYAPIKKKLEPSERKDIESIEESMNSNIEEKHEEEHDDSKKETKKSQNNQLNQLLYQES